MAILFEAAYTFLLLAVICASATAEIMHIAGKGNHPFLSTIVGGGIGLLAVYLIPFSFFTAVVVPVAATILADIVLTKVMDAADEKVMDAADNADERERNYILHGSDAEKRIKNLRLHTGEYHDITTSISAERVYEILRKAIESPGFLSEYSDVKKEAYEDESGDNVIQFRFSHAFIRLTVQNRENDTRVTIMVDESASNQMKWLDSLKLVKRVETLWDSIYILAKGEISRLDQNAALDFTYKIRGG